MKKSTKCAFGLGVAGFAMMLAPLVNLDDRSASAACAIGWEKVASDSNWMVSGCNGKSEDGTFTSKISDDQIIMVDLNGYKGGAFVLKGYGTGISTKKIVFNLIGENEITAEDGIAFITEGIPVEFTGSGSLKVRALIPIMGNSEYVTDDYQSISVTEALKSYTEYWKDRGGLVSEIVIRPTKAEEKPVEKPEEKPEESEKPEDEEKKPDNEASVEETEKENPWTVEMLTIHIAAGIYIVLSLVTFILLGIRKITRKHQPKTTKKIIIEENGKKVGETEIEEIEGKDDSQE